MLTSLRPLTDAERGSLTHIRAIRAYVGTALVALERRNTWGGPFDYSAQPIFIDEDSASRHAQSARVQGSSWSVQRVPVLAVCGRKKHLVALVPTTVVSSRSRQESNHSQGTTLGKISAELRSLNLAQFVSFVPPEQMRLKTAHLLEATAQDRAKAITKWARRINGSIHLRLRVGPPNKRLQPPKARHRSGKKPNPIARLRG